MKKNLVASLLMFLVVINTGFGQESAIYTHSAKTYKEALTLYNNKQFQAAQSLFEKVKKETNDQEVEANCAYYIANAGIRLNHRGADKLMEAFVERYPTSTKRNSAFIDVANYYFGIGKYSYALKWYKKVDQKSLSRSGQEQFNFNNGYALFVSKKYKDASKYLDKISTSEKYGSQAKYYMGYMAYQNDDYDAANQQFDQITDPDLLNEKLSYYKADMNFKLGNFQKAIDLGKEQLSKSDRNEASQLNKIIGESYFNLKNYKEAVSYLSKYRGKKGKWNNTDYYLLGYSYYKQGNYDDAIGQFNKIIGGTNSVSQNAYYHLAECYLKQNKKQEALNAFRNASQMDFSAEIEKDAWLNYARLSYEIGNAYESAPDVLAKYLDKYPNSESKQEIQELLVDSYITSKNYEAALVLLEKNRNFSTKTTYQRVAFYRGVELFSDRAYTDALAYFGKAAKEQQDALYTARALFWKAETQYLLNSFGEAILDFKQFQGIVMASQTEEYQGLNYNLGYAYFKQKDYANAATYFQKFIAKNTADKATVTDAYLRLGDSQYVNSNYWPAMEAYNKVIEISGARDKDYAAYQKAMCYGFVDRAAKKIETLEAFTVQYSKSPLRDDVLYELGNSYVKAGKTAEGLASYDKVVKEYKRSSYVPKALLRQGLIYYNDNSNEQGLTKFKQVVRDFPNSQEAIQAVATAKLIYIELGRVNEYANWVRNLDFVEVSDGELDNASYEAADRQLIQNKTGAAIKAFKAYVTNFPKGLHALKANFNLGQLYYGEGDRNIAIPYYDFVISKERNEYTEQALARLGEIFIAIPDFERAKPVFERLEQIAEFPQNVTFAQSNLMKGYYEAENYSKTIQYADKVLQTPKLDDRIKSDAHIMIARSAIATEDFVKAKNAYTKVQAIATGALAAEAVYYDAFFKNRQKEYEASNVAVQNLAKNYSTYKKFAAQGLIIMAKNFDGLGDAFQATYILESVITNFASYTDVVEEAKTELTRIKTAAAKNNSSVDPNGN